MQSRSPSSPASASNCLRDREAAAGGVNSRLLEGAVDSVVAELKGGGATRTFLGFGLSVFEPSNTGGYSVLFINDVWLVVTVSTMHSPGEGNGKKVRRGLGLNGRTWSESL